MNKLEEIRSQFPFIINNPELIYFDSAATTLKPKCVLEAITHFYQFLNSNIHRSTHSVAEAATLEFESARKKISRFIHADANEIIFTHNASYASNLLVQMLPITKEDIVLGSPIEHHSNFLPWQHKGKYYSLPLDEHDNILVEHLPKHILSKTKYLAINYVSNVTGKVQNLARLVKWARHQGITTIVDASQAMCHITIDVKSLGVDYLFFSGHKMLGPSGVGILYGRYELLKKLEPSFFGGGMAHKIKRSGHIFKPAPHCFEVGTPNIENVIGLGKAIEFLQQLGKSWLHDHLNHLSEVMEKGLREFPHLPLIRPDREANQSPIFSIIPANNQLDAHLLARLLSDHRSILTSAGQQCAHPYYEYYKLTRGTIRISLNFYNSVSEIHAFLHALEELTCFLPHQIGRKPGKIAQ